MSASSLPSAPGAPSGQSMMTRGVVTGFIQSWAGAAIVMVSNSRTQVARMRRIDTPGGTVQERSEKRKGGSTRARSTRADGVNRVMKKGTLNEKMHNDKCRMRSIRYILHRAF